MAGMLRSNRSTSGLLWNVLGSPPTQMSVRPGTTGQDIQLTVHIRLIRLIVNELRQHVDDAG